MCSSRIRAMNVADKMRIYVDTSVIGGCLDREFSMESRRLLELVRAGRLVLVISQILLDELTMAPARVRAILESVSPEHIEFVELTLEIMALRDAYLAAGVVGPKWKEDALHVAAASATGVDAIVSWNFKHIVRLDRINAYNDVNERRGFRRLTIVTPLEVVHGIDEENQEDV